MEDWLRFRGPDGSGIALHSTNVPIDFSAADTQVWKRELPGKGASAPIVVGDRVIVTCYSGYGMDRKQPGDMNNLRRHVVCVARDSGELLWQRDFKPHLPEDTFIGTGLPEHGYASSTPVSDGKRIFVFFGKSGMIALDLNGKLLWEKSLGTQSGEFQWGSAASPILCEGVLIANASDEAEAVIGLNPQTGEEVWRFPGIRNAWGTPVPVGSGLTAAVVLAVPHKLLAIAPQTGKLKWYTTNGPIDTNVAASPVVCDQSVLFMGSRSRTALLVKHSDANGDDVTKSHTLWEGVSWGQVTTPLIHQEHIYYFSEGSVCCQELSTGEFSFRERLPFPPRQPNRPRPSRVGFSSPVMAGEHIYYVTRSGHCYVLKAAPDFTLLKINEIAEDNSEFNATPAISNNQIFIRSNDYLYGIGK